MVATKSAIAEERRPTAALIEGNGTTRVARDTRTITAIDVGTSKVCTIVARRAGLDRMEVLSHATVKSEGVRKGTVTDVESVQRTVRASVEAAEQSLGQKITSAYLGVTGAHVGFRNTEAKVDWGDNGGVITAEHVSGLRGTVSSTVTDPGRKLIHALPMSYSLDGHHGIRNPIGMHAGEMMVETHMVTGAAKVIDSYVRAIEGAGIRVSGLILEPLASGQAVLTPEERERGVALVDIGGGTTDIVIFRRGRVCYTAVIPVAGHQFTSDIATAYDIPYALAEEIKLKYATTEPSIVGVDEEVALANSGRKEPRRVPRRDICQLARERAQELIGLIDLKLTEANLGDTAGFRLVLTGGASNLPGLLEMVAQKITRRVRIGAPDQISGLPEELRHPAYATGVGMLVWAMGQPEHDLSEPIGTNGAVAGGRADWLSRMMGRIRRLLHAGQLLPRRGRV